MIQVTRRFEFDAAHRLPSHPGKCRRIHGHRYAVEVTISGGLNGHGMLVDFGRAKKVLGAWFDNQLDHRTILAGDPDKPGTINAGEERLAEVLVSEAWDKDCVVVCPLGEPTAENLAAWFLQELQVQLSMANSVVTPDEASLQVSRVRVYETPSCWAEASR